MGETEDSTSSHGSGARGAAQPMVTPANAISMKDQMMWAGVIAILALLAYGPAIRGGFIWDDDRYVTQNAALRSADGLGEIWTHLSTEPQYYPLTHTTFWIEYQLWGLEPIGYHLINALLHCASAIILWMILRRLKLPGAWLVAAIFALHPVQVESVAWVAERKNVLSGLFFFLSIFTYIKSGLMRLATDDETSPSDEPQKPDWNFYGIALLLYIGGLLSKSAISPMPAVLLLIMWWKRGRFGVRDVLPLIPFFVSGIALSSLTGWMERHTVGAIGAEWDHTIAERCVIAGRAIWFYFGKLVAPLNLTFSYRRWNVAAPDASQFAYLGSAVVIAIVLWLLRNRIGRGFLAGWLFFVGMLVPALGFVNVYPMRFSYVADHFQYLACIGIFAMIVGIGAWLLQRVAQAERPRTIAATWVAGILLAVLAILTWQQSSIYANDETLWRDTLTKNDSSWLAAYNLGLALQASAARIEETDPEAAYKKRADAMRMYQQAVSVKPDYALAWRGWGDMLLTEGELAQTVSRVAAATDRRTTTTQSTTAASVTQPTTVISAHPTTAQTYDARARAKFEEAVAKYDESLRYDPKPPYSYNNKGLALRRLDRTEDAIEQFRRAIAAYTKIIEESRAKRGSYSGLSQIQRGYAPFHLNLANALETLDQSHWREAETEYRTALKINPALSDVHLKLGLLLARMGRGPDAWRELATYQQLRPDDANVYAWMGHLALSAGQGNQASTLFQQSLERQPDNAIARQGVRKLQEAYARAKAATRASTTRAVQNGE